MRNCLNEQMFKLIQHFKMQFSMQLTLSKLIVKLKFFLFYWIGTKCRFH